MEKETSQEKQQQTQLARPRDQWPIINWDEMAEAAVRHANQADPGSPEEKAARADAEDYAVQARSVGKEQ